MNYLELEKLFEKRVLAYWIDMILFFSIVLPFFPIRMGVLIVGWLESYTNNPLIVFFLLLELLIPVLFYFNLLPLLTNGRTLGLFLMKLKIVHLKERTFLGNLFSMFLRSIYSVLTLYFFRISLFVKMNNYAQLNFDEKFAISIIKYDQEVNLTENKVYTSVNCHPLKGFKFLLMIFLLAVLVSLIRVLIEGL